MNIFSIKTIKEELWRAGAAPRRSLGQNFLTCEHIADAMIESADISKGDRVLEIGPGLGAVTNKLRQTGADLVAVEKDDGLAYRLEQVFTDIEVVNKDILDVVDDIECDKVVASLPFNISKQIIRRLLEKKSPPSTMVFIVQKEVGSSIVSTPSRMTLLGTSVQFYADPEYVMTIPKNCFWPQPEIKGCVVRLELKEDIYKKEEEFFKIVRAGYSNKRKKLVNTLYSSLDINKREIERILRSLDISMMVRAEELSIEEWIQLVEKLCYHI